MTIFEITTVAILYCIAGILVGQYVYDGEPGEERGFSGFVMAVWPMFLIFGIAVSIIASVFWLWAWWMRR